MPREADKPGTYRIKPKGHGFQVSGVDESGARVKFVRSTLGDAEEAAKSIFGDIAPTGVKLPDLSPPPASGVSLDAPLDDWGLPEGLKVNAQTASMFAPKVPAPEAAPTKTPEELSAEEKARKEAEEKQLKRKQNARSIAGLIGYGYSLGIVRGTRYMLEENHAVVAPDTKDVKSLQENAKDAISETFGDKEVGPWAMTILLSFSIPLSMWLQSRKLSVEEKKEREEARKAKLRLVP